MIVVELSRVWMMEKLQKVQKEIKELHDCLKYMEE